MKKQILVTGSSGFIGQYVVEEVVQKYGEVLFFDKKENLDIFEQSQLLEIVISQCDAVIHLAAETSVAKSHKDEAKTYYTNVLGTARVLENCYKYKKKIVFASSASVYNPESSPYAMSKKIAEDMVWGFRKKIPVTILRLFNVYGEGMHSSTAMSRFLNDRKITVNGTGNQTRDFICVEDVAKLLVDSVKNKWNNKIVDVGTGISTDIYYIADTFRHFRGHKKIYYSKPVKEVFESKADVTLLNSLYKEPLQTDVIADIERMIKRNVNK